MIKLPNIQVRIILRQQQHLKLKRKLVKVFNFKLRSRSQRLSQYLRLFVTLVRSSSKVFPLLHQDANIQRFFSPGKSIQYGHRKWHISWFATCVTKSKSCIVNYYVLYYIILYYIILYYIILYYIILYYIKDYRIHIYHKVEFSLLATKPLFLGEKDLGRFWKMWGRAYFVVGIFIVNC